MRGEGRGTELTGERGKRGKRLTIFGFCGMPLVTLGFSAFKGTCTGVDPLCEKGCYGEKDELHRDSGRSAFAFCC